MKDCGELTSVEAIERSTSIDFKLDSLEFEMKVLTGESRMMTDTWQAEKFLHGFDLLVAGGKVILTKFWDKVPLIDLGKSAVT